MPDPRVLNLRDLRVERGGRLAFDLPAGVARVDRRTKWGNPFTIGDPHPTDGYPMTRAVAVWSYRNWLIERLAEEPDFLEPLRGKRLACWCAPDLCHAEVILEMLEKGT